MRGASGRAPPAKGGKNGAIRRPKIGGQWGRPLPLHRTRWPLSERQDHASRSHPRPHRRDSRGPAAIADKIDRRRREPGSPRPRHERRPQRRRRAASSATPSPSSTAPAPSSSSTRARSRSPRATRPSSCASPTPSACPALQIILKQLEDRGIPHFLFLNKIDASEIPVRELIPVLQPASTKPLVLRQIPIWENGVATGFVDLASERAYVYRAHAPSEIVELPAGVSERENEARFHMLEQLADYDDELMEQLLVRHADAARQGVRRSDRRVAQGADLPGAARLGAERERHLAALEGAAPRGADVAGHRAPPQARERQVGGLRVQDAAHRARRQAFDCARADGRVRRRHHRVRRRRARRSAPPASSRCAARSR